MWSLGWEFRGLEANRRGPEPRHAFAWVSPMLSIRRMRNSRARTTSHLWPWRSREHTQAQTTLSRLMLAVPVHAAFVPRPLCATHMNSRRQPPPPRCTNRRPKKLETIPRPGVCMYILLPRYISMRDRNTGLQKRRALWSGGQMIECAQDI